MYVTRVLFLVLVLVRIRVLSLVRRSAFVFLPGRSWSAVVYMLSQFFVFGHDGMF